MTRATLKPMGHDQVYEVVKLSRREALTLRLLCEGKETKEIAAATSLSVRWVDEIVASLVSGLGLRQRKELVLWAMQHPECWLPNVYVDRKLHEAGCQCRSIWCTAMRLAREGIDDGRKAA